MDLTAGGTCEGAAFQSSEDGPYERFIVEDVICRGSSVRGAGVYLQSGGSVLRDCLIRNSEGQSEGQGRGGALDGDRVDLIERCAFIDNRLTPASPTSNGEVLGGGVYLSAPEIVRNSTFSGNVAQAGDGDQAGTDGGSAYGGGLHIRSAGATSSLSSLTFVGNRALAGRGADGFLDGEALGGGLYVHEEHTSELTGTILTGNTVTYADGHTVQEDCYALGTLTSLGHNLAVNPDSSCVFSSFADVTGLDPGLYPVDDYGCATPLPDGSCVPAAAIDQASWATDWGSCDDAAVSDDARGLLRRQDILGVPNLTTDACDVGAFEARDSDGDGVTDVADLCPNDAHADQVDSDGDQVGDACDA
ncbi:MAG: thrombospondin type 3 repeat-containing protein, partial [Acidobacteriota bacterium]